MPHNLRYSKLILLFFVFVSYSLFAQKTEITGLVKDSLTLAPIEGVVVKALDGKKMLAFAITSKSGAYKLSFANVVSQFSVTFQHIAYQSSSQLTSNKLQKLNAALSPKAVSLREAYVKAPEVIVKKDTISFNVNSFKSTADRSIEDVIKKLPGVKVADDGKIAYQGKAISKFNIEGLDMLGGKYTLATRNVQAKDVNRVEMVENYQEVKQLQGKEPSEQVAMNLKLNKEAQMRLIGSAELGAGYREDEALYHGALTGMTFNKKWQFLGVVKTNNWGSPLDGDLVNHFGEYYGYNIADVLVSGNMTSFPPVSYSRSHEKNDLMGTLNSVVPLSKVDNLRVNADYIRRGDNFSYQSTSNYFLGTNNVVINEAQKSEFFINSLRANVAYQHNSDKLYVNNFSSFQVKKQDNEFALITNGNPIWQKASARLSAFQNKLYLFKKSKNKQYSFNSNVSYSEMPENSLTFTNVPGVSGKFIQTARGTTFSTDNGTSFGYDLGKQSRLNLGVALRADYDKVFTNLQRSDSTVLNQNDGYKITTSLSPSYNLFAPDRRRYSLTVNMPVSFFNINYKNRLNRNADFLLNRPFFSPSINGFYQFSAFTKMSVSSGIRTNVGDITDFVINPIQSTYKQQSVKSGILVLNKYFSSNLNVEYKDPLNLFFANGGVSYGNTWRNIISNQTVVTGGSSDVSINTSGVADNNISRNSSISGGISKKVNSIATNFRLDASYGISDGQQIRQSIKTIITSRNFNISPVITTTILKKVEVNYWMNYGQNTQNSTNYSVTYHQQSHGLRLSYNPVDPVFIYGSVDFARHEIMPKNYKNTQFFDAGIRYKKKKLEFELKLNNLLNTKEYSYTVLNDLDRFSYTYHLNPREVVAILKFNL